MTACLIFQSPVELFISFGQMLLANGFLTGVQSQDESIFELKDNRSNFRTLWAPGVVFFSQHKPDESEGEQASRCVHNQIYQTEMTIGQHPLEGFVAQTNEDHIDTR